MRKDLKSFKIQKGKIFLDYRLGENLDLKKVSDYFQESYQIKKLWQGTRHVLGILKKKGVEYFLKLSTSEGISIVTKNEYKWNNYFNLNYSDNDFVVPKNYDGSLFNKKYYYIISDYLEGKLLNDVEKYLPQIIQLSESIQQLPKKDEDYKKRFINKVCMWYRDIPVDVLKKYKINTLFKTVENGINELTAKVRHGDFAPWHMIIMADGRLGLIDGEHFLVNGVENYDICYFIQRVFSVSKKQNIAKEIYSQLLKRQYNVDKLKTVLASRAIGGFLDESLVGNPDYKCAEKFMDWVLGL